MKSALTALLVLSLIAEAVVWLQTNRILKDLENHHDEPLTDEEVRYIESRTTLLQVTSILSCGLLIVRVVVYDILPLIRG